LKSVRPDRAVDARLRDRLRQEVRSARQVVSPNVCRIFDLVVEDGEEYISMEYVEGETLAEAMRAGDRLRSTRRARSAPSFWRVSMRSTRPVSCTAISSPRT
jgi:serine/threonine-protein kinase